MDSVDIFRKLIHGARFDLKRFHADAEKLKIVTPSRNTKENDLFNNLQAVSLDHNLQNHDTGLPNGSNHKRKRCGNQRKSKKAKTASGRTEETFMVNKSTDRTKQAIRLDLRKDQSENIYADDSDDEQALRIVGNVTLDKLEGGEVWQKKKKKKVKSVHVGIEKASALHREHVSCLRNQHQIHVYGTDVPDPIATFEELRTIYHIHPRLLRNLKDAGFVHPTPIEMQATTVMMQGRELMACAPTGSGKTLAFVLPILHDLSEPRKTGVRALVLAPTRELAKQTYEEFRRLGEGLGLRVHIINKTTEYEKKGAFNKYDIIVTTPNRLLYLLSQDSIHISLSSVKWLVVDESDKLFEEGKCGFRDQLATVYKACDSKDIRRAMFSATFSYDVEEWCRLNLDNVVQVFIGARNSATETIEQSLLYVGDESGKLLAIRDIIRKEVGLMQMEIGVVRTSFRKGLTPPVLVFVQSKERAKELFHELIYDGINVDVIHADRTQLQRDNSVASLRCGKIWVLICTELMGRGIDFKGVNLVINYDFPNSAISYIHRIGRTGRAGRFGKAVTFFTDDDAVYLRSIVNVMRTAGCFVPEYMLQIKAPSRKKRKKLAKTSLERESISTDIHRKPKKFKNIKKSNRMKKKQK